MKGVGEWGKLRGGKARERGYEGGKDINEERSEHALRN